MLGLRHTRRARPVQAALLAVVIGGTLAVSMPAATAAPSTCDGTLTGSYKRLIVPAGATCTLDGATVEQGVRVLAGGSLITSDAEIGGNVMGRGADTVRIIDTNVGHNIKFDASTGPTVIGSSGCRVDPLAGNNIQLTDSLGTIAICYMTIDNNLQLRGNTRNIGVFNNAVGNNIQLHDNSGDFIRLRRNTADINIQVFRNQSTARLINNAAGNRFMCMANTPAPEGRGNTGVLTGQCVGLG